MRKIPLLLLAVVSIATSAQEAIQTTLPSPSAFARLTVPQKKDVLVLLQRADVIPPTAVAVELIEVALADADRVIRQGACGVVAVRVLRTFSAKGEEWS